MHIWPPSGGTTCPTLIVRHTFSSNVANYLANHGYPGHGKQRIERTRSY